MSLEVLDGSFAASLWAHAWGDSLVETAVVHGALDWGWRRQGVGVVFELELATAAAWDRFRTSDTVRAALESAPDPTAVIVYRGRASSTGTAEPRRPRPWLDSGAAALAMPLGEFVVEEDFRVFSGDVEGRRAQVRR